jgi:hypothetical protein
VVRKAICESLLSTSCLPFFCAISHYHRLLSLLLMCYRLGSCQRDVLKQFGCFSRAPTLCVCKHSHSYRQSKLHVWSGQGITVQSLHPISRSTQCHLSIQKYHLAQRLVQLSYSLPLWHIAVLKCIVSMNSRCLLLWPAFPIRPLPFSLLSTLQGF